MKSNKTSPIIIIKPFEYQNYSERKYSWTLMPFRKKDPDRVIDTYNGKNYTWKNIHEHPFYTAGLEYRKTAVNGIDYRKGKLI